MWFDPSPRSFVPGIVGSIPKPALAIRLSPRPEDTMEAIRQDEGTAR
jgi:hypothetical protein